MGLPVEHWNYDENKVGCALHAIVGKDGSPSAFYVGATTNARRRFLGGWSRGERMPGHCQRLHSMTVVHLATGIGARRVETNLIHYAMEAYAHLCTNVATDSRGVSPHWPAFIYVCAGPLRMDAGGPGWLLRPKTPAPERANSRGR